MKVHCDSELIFVCLLLVLFLIFNIGLNYYDNWVLSRDPSGLGFPAPFFYAMCHSLACILCSLALIYGTTDVKINFQLFRPHKFKLFLNSVLLSASIVMANFMIEHASTAVINVFRASVALPTVVFAFAIEGKTYSIPKIVLVFVIVISSVISVPPSTFSGDGTGYGLAFAATICIAAKASVSAKLLKHANDDQMTPFVVMFFDSVFTAFFMFTASMIAGETIKLSEIRSYQPGVVGIGMTVGALLAFPYNYVTYKLIQLTSSVAWAIATSFKLFVVIVIPMLIYDRPSWAGTYIGFVMFLVSCVAYGLLEQKYEDEWLDALPFRGSSNKPGEGTPLNKDKPASQASQLDHEPGRPKSWMAM